MSKLIATFFGAGLLRPAPGTWGSLAALPVAWLIIEGSGFVGLLACAILAFGLGYWATQEQTKGKADHDPSEIVIDEVAGQWIALLPVAYGAGMMNVESLRLWPGWVAAFLFFRLFDILKPGPVGWADRKHNAMGVMLDDVIAGVFAAVAVVILGTAFHAVMG